MQKQRSERCLFSN